MKEAIGGISIFQIVIVFIIAFAGIAAFTINRSRAYAVKDEIITIIETNNDNTQELSSNTVSNIIGKMNEFGHRNEGKCDEGWIGYNRNGAKSSKNPILCVRSVNVNEAVQSGLSTKCGKNNEKCIDEYPDLYYYEIVIFYQLDIPIVNQLFPFKLTGSTRIGSRA